MSAATVRASGAPQGGARGRPNTAATGGASATLRQVMAQYPTGVTVITSRAPDGAPRGQVVGTFLRVSDEPELVGFLAMHSSRTWQATRPTLDRFCVNLVSDHQESVCRDITAGGASALAAIPHSESQGGNPAIHGAIAHIDCAVEAIHSIGDHDFVVGRVEQAQLVSAAHPMVFFRGGFGRFATATRSSHDHDFRAQLAEVDLIRSEMDALAAATGCEVTINSLDGDETVVVAAAASVGPGALRVRVGQRLPFAAPFGSLEAAFGSEELRRRWLDADVTTGKSREENLAVLDAVRSRGYAISYGHAAHARIVTAAQQLAKRDPSRRDEHLAQLRDLDEAYNGVGAGAGGAGAGAGGAGGAGSGAGAAGSGAGAASAGAAAWSETLELRSIAVPVYGFDGGLAYGLTLWGPTRPVTRSERGVFVAAALRCAGACSAMLGG